MIRVPLTHRCLSGSVIERYRSRQTVLSRRGGSASPDFLHTPLTACVVLLAEAARQNAKSVNSNANVAFAVLGALLGANVVAALSRSREAGSAAGGGRRPWHAGYGIADLPPSIFK
jgi:hypothetical protein